MKTTGVRRWFGWVLALAGLASVGLAGTALADSLVRGGIGSLPSTLSTPLTTASIAVSTPIPAPAATVRVPATTVPVHASTVRVPATTVPVPASTVRVPATTDPVPATTVSAPRPPQLPGPSSRRGSTTPTSRHADDRLMGARATPPRRSQPPSGQAVQTCEIVWWRGYLTGRFQAWGETAIRRASTRRRVAVDSVAALGATPPERSRSGGRRDSPRAAGRARLGGHPARRRDVVRVRPLRSRRRGGSASLRCSSPRACASSVPGAAPT